MRSAVRYAPVLAAVLLVFGCSQDAESPTGPEPQPALEVATVSALSFIQVTAGYLHTCGVTARSPGLLLGIQLLRRGWAMAPLPVA